jgi:hypothetical protein
VKLEIELVPSSSWFNNVRAVVTAKQWNAIKSAVSSKAYDLCEICGGVGPKHPVECHEIWSYDEKKSIQKLEGMIALCPDCHQVKHFGFAQVQGKGDKALAHLMKINKLKKPEAEKYVKEAFELWSKRSQKSWTLDISHLKDYGIDINGIKQKL